MARFDVNAALKAGYTQAEIDDFMKKNNAVAPGQPDNEVARTLSSLESIPLLGSLLSPATKAVRFAGETGAQTVRSLTDPAFRKTLFDPKSLTEADAAHIQAAPKTFLMPEAQIATPEDILKSGARATAGAMSYAVPGGSTLKGALVAGGAMGALSSASADDSNLASIGAGGLGGVAGGGLAYGGTKLFGKALESLSKRATQEADNLTLKGIRPSPSQVTNFKKDTGQNMMDVVKKYGFFDKGADQVDNVINPLQEAFDSIAQSSDKNISKAELSKKFAEVIKQYRNSPSPELQKKGNDIMQYAVNYIGQQGDNVSLASLTSERKIIDKLVKEFKFDPTISGKNEQIRNILQDAVRTGAGDSKVGGKGITEMGKELQALYALLPIAEKQGNLGKGALNFGLTDAAAIGAGSLLGLPGGPGGVAAGAIAGELAKRAINSPQASKIGIGALNAIAPGLSKAGVAVGNQAGSKILQTIPSVIGGQIASPIGKQGAENNNSGETNNQSLDSTHSSPIVPQAGDMVQIYDNQEKKTISVPRSELANYGLSENPDQAPQNGQPSITQMVTPDKIAQAMLMDLAKTGGKNLGVLKTLQDQITVANKSDSPTSAKRTQFDKKFDAAEVGIDGLIKSSQEGGLVTGPVAGRVQKFKATTVGDPASAKTRVDVALSRTLIKNALIGSNMTEGEINSIADAVLDTNLPKDEFQARLVALKDYLRKIRTAGPSNATTDATPDVTSNMFAQ